MNQPHQNMSSPSLSSSQPARFGAFKLYQVQQLVKAIDCPHLECDGLSYILHELLSCLGICHQVWFGQLGYEVKGEVVLIEPHVWIELPDNCGQEWRIDCRPHPLPIQHLSARSPLEGIFRVSQSDQVLDYKGQVIGPPSLNPLMIQALMESPQDLLAAVKGRLE